MRLLACTTLVLTLSTPAAAEKPYWVDAMKAVNAGFAGDPGYIAQFGDSITYSIAFWTPIGWDEPDRYLTKDDALPKRPKAKRWRDTLKGFRAKGPRHGNYSGWTVGRLLRAVDPVLKGRQPEAAIVMIGTNDVAGGKVPEGYRKGLQQIVRKCLDAHCVPILTTIPPRRGRDEAVGRLNGIIRDLARRHKVPLSDYHAACLRLRPGGTWDGTIISKDGVHPTGGKTNVYTDQNMKVCGYALRNWVNFLTVRELYFHVLSAPKKPVAKAAPVEAVRKGIRCDVVADTEVSSYHGKSIDERLWNFGSSARLKCKGFEEYTLMKFDLARCKGMTVRRATLYLSRTGQCLINVTAPSTVSADWAEGTGTGNPRNAGNQAAASRGGATYTHAVYPDRTWAGPGSNFKYVVFGEGGSTCAARPTGRAKDAKGDYYTVELPPEVIHGMLVEGDSYGLALTDEKGQRAFQSTYRSVPNPNHYVSSRESGRPCFLIVEGERTDRTPPAPVSRASAAPGAEAGDVILRWTCTADDGAGGGKALGYRVYLSQSPLADGDLDRRTLLPRHLTYRPGPPGRTQVFPIRGLRPGAEYHFAVVAYDEAGNTSKPAFFKGAARPAGTIALTPHEFAPGKGAPPGNGKIRVWADPSNARVNPVTGNTIAEAKYADPRPAGAHRRGSAVWDPKARTVTLFAGRNDFAGFQLSVENLTAGAIRGLQVRCADLAGRAGGRIPARNITVHWQWSVKDREGTWYPDALVPLSGPLSIPNVDNRMARQKVQSFYVDVWVPHKTPPGQYGGRITVAAAGATISLPVRLRVWRFTLPDRLSFVCDMNGYGYPRCKSWAGALNLHRLAHRNRLNVDIVPYSHSGNFTVSEMAMETTGKGAAMRVRSFDRFDRHFGPLLTGEAFAASPRAGVPVAAMYLPLYENWPCRLKDGFTFDQSARHVDITRDFTEEYRRGYVAVCRQFAEHFKRTGYDRTAFQVYLNNKYRYAPQTTFWCLDEPMFRDDFLVIDMFARLTREGFSSAHPVRVDFRVDCSRCQEVRGTFDYVDLFVAATGNWRQYRRLFDDQQLTYVRRTNGPPRNNWVYGSTVPPTASNVANRAWATEAYLQGFNGLLPWLAYGKDDAWDSADAARHAVFYPAAKRWGYDGCYGSLRMKAFRDGQQDAEYLEMLRSRLGATRRELAAVLRQFIRPSGAPLPGTFSCRHLSPDELTSLRRVTGWNLHNALRRPASPRPASHK